jgi:hypothetical protein
MLGCGSAAPIRARSNVRHASLVGESTQLVLIELPKRRLMLGEPDVNKASSKPPGQSLSDNGGKEVPWSSAIRCAPRRTSSESGIVTANGS